AAAQIRAARRHVARVAGALDAHAIDVNERLVRHCHAGVAAQTNHRSAARRGRARQHRHARRTTLQQVAHRYGGFLDFVGVEPCDAVAAFPPPRRTRSTRHDDLVQAQRLFAQREILRNALTGRDYDADFDRTRANALRTDAVAAGWHVDDRVTSARAAQR